MQKIEERISKESSANIPFVGRSEQLNFFANELLKPPGKDRKPILEYYGIHGIGKSRLLKEFKDHCKTESVPCIQIDVAEAKYEADPISLVTDVVHKLQEAGVSFRQKNLERISKVEREFKDAHKPKGESFFTTYDKYPRQKISIVPVWLEKLEAAKIAVTDSLKEASFDKKPLDKIVLLLDADTEPERERVCFIEDYILRPMSLLQEDGINAVTVWGASQIPWQWRRPEVRQRTYTEKLQPLRLEDVTKLGLNHKIVYSLSAGVPKAVNLLVEKMKTGTIDPRELAKIVYDKYILKEVFAKVPDGLKELLTFISVAEIFDTKMLEKIGKIRDPSIENNYKDILDIFRRSGLIYWSNGLVVDATIRKIIKSYLLLENKGLFLLVNGVAVETIDEWIKINSEPKSGEKETPEKKERQAKFEMFSKLKKQQEAYASENSLS